MPFIDSRAVRRVEWEAGTLSVWFADGDRYDYAGVPERVYDAFLAAPSAGAFFAEHVRDKYAFRKVRRK
ncbi:KTSC domain-containing protein [Paracoccus sp. S-4012]|uniref:KTSC domain-containing protein n=1 Tax=Paracoccus sp. S-4012 TaxID=2665648 RepID=UPI0012B0346C|nr:KTSC domain-containing protein [Paracoccus sp. S-4012]MRX49761.1 KTSC domain-containing protein [Paracoccus sp. S-4012]